MKKNLTVKVIEKLIKTSDPIRPKSMIITLLGDLISVEEGRIWSSHLVNLNEWFGITEQATRVSLQRLTEEGWISKEKFNHHSYFSYSDMGERAYQLNQSFVYQMRPNQWENRWQILILRNHEDNLQLIKEISWFGFRKIYKNIYLIPRENDEEITAFIKHKKIADFSLLFSGTLTELSKNNLMGDLVGELWETEKITARYQNFLKAFSPITPKLLEEIVKIPELALYLRLRIIHEYRRLVLTTPTLPADLKPNEIEKDAYDFTAQVYRLLAHPSQNYWQSLKENVGGLGYALNDNKTTSAITKKVLERFTLEADTNLKNSSSAADFSQMPFKKIKDYVK